MENVEKKSIENAKDFKDQITLEEFRKNIKTDDDLKQWIAWIRNEAVDGYCTYLFKKMVDLDDAWFKLVNEYTEALIKRETNIKKDGTESKS